MLKSLKAPVLSFLGFILIGVVLEFGFSAFIQITALFVLVNIILAMSLNLVNGTTGQFSLGHAGFMAVGAYVSAYSSQHWVPLPESLGFLNFIIYAVLAGLFAAFFGFLVGQPSLRLKGDYLAIVTLGFGEIIRVALLNMDFLGGARGIHAIPTLPEGWGLSRFMSQYLFGLFWTVTCFFVLWRIIHSSHGRALLSVREDEIAAEAMGVNTTSMKVRAFVIAAFFAGVAGAMSAHYVRYISPSSFGFLKSVDVVIMVVLGGMGSMTGAIFAAILVTLLPEVLRGLQDLTGVDLRMVIYSLALILVMILRPKGLFGEMELPDLWRRYVRRSS
ncbi:MAG: branched-chain amino acid ABC transporter permease [Bdellovibrionaceae bacterium]|nr:branched-chain amino acid ABC transporter permease [Pseudobdellovibrionaceae bacterium]MBX3033066.1 branched-chain amino acid ABC transporter permease [Pseudobdellovibrionaceae bacterium]